MTGIKAAYALALTVFTALSALYLKRRLHGRWPQTSLLAILFVAGSLFSLVFARTEDLNYQGRQFAPAISLLVGVATALSLKFLRSPGISLSSMGKKTLPLAAALIVATAFYWTAEINRTSQYVKDWPNHAIEPSLMKAYQEMGSMIDDGVIFYIDVNSYGQYLQPPPPFEYYSGRTVLFFKHPDDAVRDFLWFKRNSSHPFQAVISSPQAEAIEWFLTLTDGRARLIDDTFHTLAIKW